MQDKFDEVMQEVVHAVTNGDQHELDRVLAEVIAREHAYDEVTVPLLGKAALDETLPVFNDNGGLLTDPAPRFTLALGPGAVGNLRELESLYRGESLVRDGCVIGGSERRNRAWSAFLLALYHYTEENAPQAALWAERALGLDTESAAGWGAWYYLWHGYFGVGTMALNALPPGPQPLTEELRFALTALDWVTEIVTQMDPKCANFIESTRNLAPMESGWQTRFHDHRWEALRARGCMHEDGYTCKFLFGHAMDFARNDAERVVCHQGIVLDLLTLRYNREYILFIENATETEIAEALSHCRTSWELAQELTEAGTFSQDTLRQVKGTYDMVRQLMRDREQLKNMSRAELQELLDTREQIAICRSNDDKERALQLANWCLGRANRDALTWWNRGELVMNSGDLNEAISCFRSAMAIDPDDSDYYRSLATALLDTENPGHLDEVIRRCEQGLERNSADEVLKLLLSEAKRRKQEN